MMLVNLATYSDAGFVGNFSCVDANNAAINLTGLSLRMHVRVNAADPNVWIELTNTNGRLVVTNAATGALKIVIPYSVLLLLPPGNYVHSLVSTDVGGNRADIWQGSLVHSAGPTRWGSS